MKLKQKYPLEDISDITKLITLQIYVRNINFPKFLTIQIRISWRRKIVKFNILYVEIDCLFKKKERKSRKMLKYKRNEKKMGQTPWSPWRLDVNQLFGLVIELSLFRVQAFSLMNYLMKKVAQLIHEFNV